jgi:hypothetical protein
LPPTRLRSSPETVFDSGNRKVEIKHSKRSSSPNIGEFFTTSNVDIHIHPEFKVQLLPKSSAPVDTPRKKPILKKGSRSFPSAKRSPFRSFESDRTCSSSYSYDEESEELDKIADLNLTTDYSTSPSTSSTTTVVEVYEATDEKSSTKKQETDTAAKFFLVKIFFSFVRFLISSFFSSFFVKGIRHFGSDGRECFKHLKKIIENKAHS